MLIITLLLACLVLWFCAAILMKINHYGTIQLNWSGESMAFTFLEGGFYVLCGLFVIFVIFIFMSWVYNWPRRRRLRLKDVQYKKSFDHVCQALGFLNAGDYEQAKQILVPLAQQPFSRPFTHYVEAKIARLQQDFREASYHDHCLMQQDSTVLLGLQGIVKESSRLKDFGSLKGALIEAQKKFPHLFWIQDMLFDVYRLLGQWDKAAGLCHKQKNRDLWSRRQAICFYEQSLSALREGTNDQGLALAHKAHQLMPPISAIHCHYIKILLQFKGLKAAHKVVKNIWKHEPHAEFMALFTDQYTLSDRLFQKIIKPNSTHLQSLLARIDRHIMHEQFNEASQLLRHMTCRNNDWCKRAKLVHDILGPESGLTADLDPYLLPDKDLPQWTCQKCHHTSDQWFSVCTHCRGFDTYTASSIQEPLNTLVTNNDKPMV
jgi:HemY protein